MSRLAIVTVIQARLGSTRLPRKVVLPLGRATVLQHMVERVRRSRRHGTLVVATTTESADDAIVRLCEKAGVPCYRGHPEDLLDRHYQVARAFDARAVVKIPSDCPLIDWRIIDRVIGTYEDAAGAWDYVSNLHPPTYPDGNDVEIMGMAALETAWRCAIRPFEREHTTPFLWERPDRFHVGNVIWETGQDLSHSHRVVLDYLEDYTVIRLVFDSLSAVDQDFGVADVARWLDDHPEVAALNAGYRGVNWYRHHLDELRTVTSADTRLAPQEAAP